MGTLRYSSRHVVLEPERWQIRVGDEVIRPEPKVFEFLCFMMRNPGRVVTKAELLDALWSGDVVGESVLTRCVSCARKLLLDDARTPSFIRTLHGRGYQYIAPVAELPASSVPPARTSEPPPAPDLSLEAETPARVFVGRAAELSRLKEALRSLGGGPSRLVLLSGEAGIGKSRLLEEVAAHTPPGVDLHWGRASTAEGAPPFTIWQQCFRSLVRQRSLKSVLRAFGDAPSGARKLFLGADRWQAGESLGWDTPSQRFRMFDAVARALSELAAQRPLVLLLDDIHSADAGSLLLLGFLAQELTGPALMLAALRDPEAIAEPARQAALAALRSATREELMLAGLSGDEVRQLVELRLERVDQELAVSLRDRTGGNPFFLSVLTPPGAAQPASEATLPTAVRQAVLARLALLEPETRSLLELAAVAGRDVDPLLLARAAGVGAERCLRALSEATALRVVEAAGGSAQRFVHDLLREVLVAELDPSARAELHWKVGNALAGTPDYQGAGSAALLAHHFVQAVPHAGGTLAVDHSIRAGAYALRNLAYEEAISHFTRASQLLPLVSDVDPASECAVLLDLGLAQVSAGQREAGQKTLHLAAGKARAIGATPELASVALNLAPGLFAIENGTYDPDLIALLREALTVVGDGNDALRALLLSRLALALYWADTFAERVSLLEEAERLAAALGDDVRAYVLTARAFALLRPSTLAERRALCARAVELSGRAGDYQGLLLDRLLLAQACLECGDLAAWAFEVEAFEKLAQEGRQPQALWIVQAQRACKLLNEGRLEPVEALAGACLVAGQRVSDHNALLTFGVHLTLVRLEQGRGHEVLDVIRQYAAAYPRITGWRVLYAYALCRSAEHKASAAELRSLAAGDFALPDDLNWPVSMAWLAELCHAHRDGDSARGLYQRLLPFAERLVVVGYGIACAGPVERYLALLAATQGLRPEADAHFQKAIATSRAHELTLSLAHTLHEYAAFLAEDPLTRASASEPLSESRRLAEQGGLAALLSRLEALAP
jgi:DNA-binding winged helix-turn-helix (wHTH) protein